MLFYEYENYTNEMLEKENVSTLLLSPEKRVDYLSYLFNKEFYSALEKKGVLWNEKQFQ